MLFELDDDHLVLKPVPFDCFGDHGRSESTSRPHRQQPPRHTLPPTPAAAFHQERPFQAVADIYALNQHGAIVIRNGD